jgi:ribosome-binding factor A
MSNRSRGHRAKPGSPHGVKGPTQRQLQAGELIRHALVEIIRREDLRDPAVHGVSITISEVRTSPDLKHAHVFVSPLGKGDPQTIADGLNRCAGFLRGRLGREVELRFTPELHFLPDVSFAEASHINDILHSEQVRRDLAAQEAKDAKDAEDRQDS